MPDSEFISAFNEGNDAFAAAAGESFQVATGGNPGTYEAVNIDDVVAANSVGPGGVRGDNTVNVFINRTVFTTAGIRDGAILVVRTKRVRVQSITDEADNTLLLICGPAGVKL